VKTARHASAVLLILSIAAVGFDLGHEPGDGASIKELPRWLRLGIDGDAVAALSSPGDPRVGPRLHRLPRKRASVCPTCRRAFGGHLRPDSDQFSANAAAPGPHLNKVTIDSCRRTRGVLPAVHRVASSPRSTIISGTTTRRLLLLALLAVPGGRCTAQALLPASIDVAARVVGSSNDDTPTVLNADRFRVKIRLHGIDAPDTGQDVASRAAAAAWALAFGTQVAVRPRDTDR
jgi:hypothetical protein